MLTSVGRALLEPFLVEALSITAGVKLLPRLNYNVKQDALHYKYVNSINDYYKTLF